MRTIGLIGGMSWESSLEYYRIINEEVKRRLGGLHSASCLLYSFDFAPLERMQHDARWDDIADEMASAARRLEAGGAELVLLCTNTMHKVANAIYDSVSIPFIHIADPTAGAIRADGIDRVGLLGTRFTMEDGFYVDRLRSLYGVEAVVPSPADREAVHRVIYDELCVGSATDESRARFRAVIAALVADGAQGVILGCTEIGLLVGPADSPVPLYDTTRLHAQAAVELALG
ncbi:MAG: aspartate/glutamate racemase family protein [Spirochaetaceae bacterium]|nr:MAG: aspartate/glutamate racemase family protein [Spirochaetaceae bacterium]